MRRSFTSLRVRLFVLVLIATIPASGIILYSGLTQREHERQEALANALKLAQEISSDHDHLIKSARRTLFTLSKIPQVQQQDKDACCKIFAHIMQQAQGFRPLVGIKPNGDMFASSIGITRPINYLDRPWFQRVLKTRDFVIGEYLIGRVSGKPLIALAHPVFDDRGNLKAVLSLGMDFDWLKQTLVHTKLPEGASVSLIDSGGTILLRHPDPGNLVGKSMPEASLVKTLLEKREGVEEAIGLHGVRRLFGFTSLGKGLESVHVSVGIPKEVALAKAEEALRKNLAYLGLIAFLALAVAWFMGGVFIIRPVNRLLDATKQLAKGDLTVRAGLSSCKGEIGQLAYAFDQMAESLEHREIEKKRAEEALGRSEKEAKGLAQENGIIAEIGRIVSSTLNIEEVYERFAEEVRKLVPFDRISINIIHPEDNTAIVTYVAGVGVTDRGLRNALPLTGTVIGECRRTRSSLLIQTESTDAVLNRFPLLLPVFKAGLKSIMSVCLISRDEVIGALNLFSTEPNAYTEKDLGVAERVSNQIAGAIANAQLFAERTRAEEALRQSEEKFRKIFEEGQIGMVMTGPDFRFRMANQAFCAMIGYENEELMGLTFGDITHAEHASQDLEGVRALWRGEIASYRTEKRYVRKNGDAIWGSVVASLIRDRKGQPLYALAMIEDITERKWAEEALRKSEEKFKDLYDNAPIGYQEHDSEGRIYNINRTHLGKMGYTFEEMAGQPVWKFVVEEETSRHEALDRLRGAMPPGQDIERTFRRKDGTTFPVLIQERALRDEHGRITAIRSAIQDITDRKRAKEENASLQEQLRQSQKMEAVGQFAGDIAHDFNNLLTVIEGYCQLSLSELPEDVPLRDDIGEIQKAANRAADLTRQLLAFGRRQILEVKVLDLNTLVKDLDKMLHRIIGEDIELVTHLGSDLGRVKADPGQIEQVIMNIVVNARDAMHGGGKLTIETAGVELDQAYVCTHSVLTPGRYVMLAISDTGEGMTSEVREQIFEPFFTTKEKGKGTGLGLSTVYGIVKQSGGHISVYSEPGKGTTFKIYFPRVDEPLLGELRRKTERKELFHEGETILVVEDEKEVRKLAVRILEKQGYRMLEASTGENALLVCKEHKEPIHLLLTDVVMPGMNGRELMESLTSLRPETKVLFMSGYADDAIARHGVLEEGMNYIQKPFATDRLIRKVREVLDKDRSLAD